MARHRMEYAWRTDKGRVRSRNEDAVSVLPKLGLVVVADGIGGSMAGEVASRLAVHVICESFRENPAPPSDREKALDNLRETVEEADRLIWESAQSSPRYTGMGTTVVVGYTNGEWLVYAHVGDSRIYRLRGGELVQLTRDHSLIQEVVDQGFFPSLEDALHYGINENIITRGLGTSNSVRVDVNEVDLRAGDLFLFCSDGLSGMVRDDGLRRMLSAEGTDLEGIADGLVALAMEGGGLDNITLALARVY